MVTEKQLQRIAKDLTDQGKVIQAGWIGFQSLLVPPETSDEARDHLRITWMCSAQHMFATIMTVLDDGEEATDDDQRRMRMIDNELQEFQKELELRLSKPQGEG